MFKRKLNICFIAWICVDNLKTVELIFHFIPSQRFYKHKILRKARMQKEIITTNNLIFKLKIINWTKSNSVFIENSYQKAYHWA